MQRLRVMIAGACLAGMPFVSAYCADVDTAARFVNAEQYEKAAREYEEAVAKEPGNASLHLSLGLVYQSLKRYRDAVGSIEKASELAPEDAQAYYSLGLLYEALALEDGQSPGPQKQYLSKAETAWEKFRRFSKNEKKIKVADRHLRNIREELGRE